LLICLKDFMWLNCGFYDSSAKTRD